MEENVEWLPIPNQVEMVISEQVPPTERVTSSFVFGFRDEKVLLTQLNHRGWDITGGHVETGESPEETMNRELYEETKAKITDIVFVGYKKITLLGEKPQDYRYPYPESYMTFYAGEISQLDDFEATEETCERNFFSYEEAKKIKSIQKHLTLFEKAYKMIKKG